MLQRYSAGELSAKECQMIYKISRARFYKIKAEYGVDNKYQRLSTDK